MQSHKQDWMSKIRVQTFKYDLAVISSVQHLVHQQSSGCYTQDVLTVSGERFENCFISNDCQLGLIGLYAG